MYNFVEVSFQCQWICKKYYTLCRRVVKFKICGLHVMLIGSSYWKVGLLNQKRLIGVVDKADCFCFSILRLGIVLAPFGNAIPASRIKCGDSWNTKLNFLENIMFEGRSHCVKGYTTHENLFDRYETSNTSLTYRNEQKLVQGVYNYQKLNSSYMRHLIHSLTSWNEQLEREVYNTLANDP